MFELLVVIAFLWLIMKGSGLAFRVAWSLLGGLLLAGGVLLLIPIALVGVGWGILKAAV